MTMLVVSSWQFCFVHSRILRSEASIAQIGDSNCDEDFKGMATFVVSSNNNSSTTHHSARSLAFRLASGPSNKGRGH